MKRHLVVGFACVLSILLAWYAFSLGPVWFLIFILGVAPALLAVVYALEQRQLRDHEGREKLPQQFFPWP